jgi:hypothetical protein
MASRRGALWIATAALLLLVTIGVSAQRRRWDPTVSVFPANPAYDGRFTMARLKYEPGPGGYYYYGLPAWAHGYGYDPEPDHGRSERNLMMILNEVSDIAPRIDDSVFVALDDPELCKYPVAYMTEAGFWTMTDKEAVAFHDYFAKGGFVIFDDFRDPPRGGGGWDNFETQMRRMFPGGRFVDLEASHPIFHSFFDIDSLDVIPQYYDRGRPVFRGLFEDNDPKKRLLAIANYNTDVSNFWQFSGTGFKPVEESNEAFKLGVNYVVYGLTH